MSGPYARPFAHPTGAVPPNLPSALVPGHVAIVMDGNGRWANAARACRAPRATRRARPRCSTSWPAAIEIGVTPPVGLRVLHRELEARRPTRCAS